jgi:hypothetical protein
MVPVRQSNARVRAQSEISREIEQALPMDFAQSALECDTFSHRFHCLNFTMLCATRCLNNPSIRAISPDEKRR